MLLFVVSHVQALFCSLVCFCFYIFSDKIWFFFGFKHPNFGRKVNWSLSVLRCVSRSSTSINCHCYHMKHELRLTGNKRMCSAPEWQQWNHSLFTIQWTIFSVHRFIHVECERITILSPSKKNSTVEQKEESPWRSRTHFIDAKMTCVWLYIWL